ncbi:MAG: cytochrome c family protein [Rhodospirillales bacterium]|nr:cytochrome c family protein [Rhodospirillales bacterium]
MPLGGVTMRFLFILSVFALFFGQSGDVFAEPHAVGPEKCQKCHTGSYKVWEGTKHFLSFKTVHKNKKARKIVKAIGERRMKKSETCVLCHYTAAKKAEKVKLVAGPSCESCHGKASEWISIHNNYGGGGAKRASETATQKAERVKKAAAAGMVWPSQLYDTAANCMSCHGLANPALSGQHAGAMLDNGHPLNVDFELVAYSQGTVRHRFYPPDVTKNKEMSDLEKARLFVIGQAAALVSATQAASKSEHILYKTAQAKRIATATAVLDKVKAQVPEAGALLQAPSAEAGRALANALRKVDLTGAVGDRLPKNYK